MWAAPPRPCLGCRPAMIARNGYGGYLPTRRPSVSRIRHPRVQTERQLFSFAQGIVTVRGKCLRAARGVDTYRSPNRAKPRSPTRMAVCASGGLRDSGLRFRRRLCALWSQTPKCAHSQGGQGTDPEHPKPAHADSQGRRWQTRREVSRPIETRKRIPDRVAIRKNETKWSVSQITS